MVRELAQSDQFIHMEVDVLANQFRFLCTAIYAANTAACRSQLWNDLSQVASSVMLPWILCGDFHSTLCVEERWKAGTFVDHDIDELQN